jgi:hypothetical protein
MKIVKKANGKTVVELTEQDWNNIGASYGWYRNDPKLIESASNVNPQKISSKPKQSSVDLGALKERLSLALNGKVDKK